MRRLHLLGLVLVAACAFVASIATSALAAPPTLLAEWLWNGSAVLSELLVDVEEELLLEDQKLGTVILCSGIFDGWVNVNGEDLITAVLNLTGTEIGTPLGTGTALECTNQANCENPLVWADNLPWPTLLELIELDNPTPEWSFVILILGTGGGPGWDVECMSIIPTSELCEAPEGVAGAMNEVTNVHGEFNDALTELLGLQLATCTVGGTQVGVVEGLGIILDTEGGNLQVSSEP
jgi:hypothetical protein